MFCLAVPAGREQTSSRVPWLPRAQFGNSCAISSTRQVLRTSTCYPPMSWGRILIVEASSRKYLALDIVLLAWKLLLSRVQKVWRANTTTTICGSLMAKEECGVISLGWHAEAALRSRQKQRVNQTTTQRAARHVDGPARFLAKEVQSILALSRK